jgi:hypothetical protein
MGRYALTPSISLLADPSQQPPIDGWGRVRVRVNVTDAQGTVSNASPPLDLQIDSRAPSAHTFRYTAEEVSFRFTDGHVIEPESVESGDLSLLHLTTGQMIDPEALSLSFVSSPLPRPVLIVRVTFPGLPGGVLPPGKWRLMLAAGAGVDLAGTRCHSRWCRSSPSRRRRRRWRRARQRRRERSCSPAAPTQTRSTTCSPEEQRPPRRRVGRRLPHRRARLRRPLRQRRPRHLLARRWKTSSARALREKSPGRDRG